MIFDVSSFMLTHNKINPQQNEKVKDMIPELKMEPSGVEPPSQPCEGRVLPLNYGPNQSLSFIPSMGIHFGANDLDDFSGNNRSHFTTNIHRLSTD